MKEPFLFCWYAVFHDGRKKNYYVNVETGKTQWGLPPEKIGQKLPPGWERHLSVNISPETNYYYHPESGRTQWVGK
jgi:hypothetical protein